jgi:hypothetical protein
VLGAPPEANFRRPRSGHGSRARRQGIIARSPGN